MAVDSTVTGSGIDLNQLFQSAITGGNMGNLFGSNDNMGGGMIGGLILGSLLRNNGNLFGGNGDGAAIGAGGAMLRTPPEQAAANMSLMAGIGDIKQAVAVGVATTETSNANQTGQLTSAVLQSTSANQLAVAGVKDAVNANSVVLMQQLNQVNTNIMESKYELSRDITADGEKTRALITANMVTDLNNQLADLRVQRAIADNGVTVTNNINQNQAQQQQQQQLGFVVNALSGVVAELQRNTQSVVNLGTMSGSAGSQTANNTRVNG
jgi:hypothetical protein